MSAPLVVNTTDGTVWTRRTETRGGLPLYAIAGAPDCCPPQVMATYAELEEHGIAGEADVLPVPVGPEPRVLSAERERMIRIWHEELARLSDRTAVARREALGDLLAEIDRLRGERHVTNESLSEAAEALREQRDRIAALEAVPAPLHYAADGEGWTVHAGRVEECSLGCDGKTWPPLMPWASLMDDEDLADFVDELAASAATNGSSAGCLAAVEDTVARWRVIAEAQHAHNTAPGPSAEESADKLARLLAPSQALREGEAAEVQPLTVYRASHGSIVLGLYATAAAARKHCEALARREHADNSSAQTWWREDEDTVDQPEDGEQELIEHVTPKGFERGFTRPTGYLVTPLEVASEYDEEADE